MNKYSGLLNVYTHWFFDCLQQKRLTFGFLSSTSSSFESVSAYSSLSCCSLKLASRVLLILLSVCLSKTHLICAGIFLFLFEQFCSDKVERLKCFLGGGVIIPFGVITWFMESFDRHLGGRFGFKGSNDLETFCFRSLLLIWPMEPKLNLLLIRSGGVTNPVGVCIILIEESDAAANDDLFKGKPRQLFDEEQFLSVSKSGFWSFDRFCLLNDFLRGGGVMSCPSSVQILLMDVFDP